MANVKNLKKLSPSEARKNGQKGGIASGKARKERADLRKQLQLWMETEVAEDAKGNPITGAEYMTQIAVKQMSKGNPKFWELVRDTAGFKPVDKVMVADVEQSVIDEVEKAVLNDANT